MSFTTFVFASIFDSELPAVDLVWVLVCSALVLLMQAGFCFLECGLVRAKNSVNVAMKNLADLCVGGVLFWMVGFGLMFGVSVGGWIGSTHFAVADGPSLLCFALFQLMFCGTATTIISGAVAERIRFGGYLAISCLVCVLIYPVFGHWAWGGAIPGTGSGWLAKMGFIDFAGSTVVHAVGGWIALVAIVILGPRDGRFDKEQSSHVATGHSYAIAATGVMLLWFGWLGFNGGSLLGVSTDLPRIVFNTMLAGAAGGAVAMAYGYSQHLAVRPSDVMGGTISGLVAVTAGCHCYGPIAAVLIAGVSGALFVVGSNVLVRLRIDDVVGAVPSHAVAGVWGTMAVALFAEPQFLADGVTRGQQLAVQMIGSSAAFLWAFGVGGLGLIFLNRHFPLRIDQKAEQQGLDLSEHATSSSTLRLLDEMKRQSAGELDRRASVEPNTDAGQIAAIYNDVLDRFALETESRKQASVALARAEAEYRLLFENSVEGVYRRDAAGAFTAVNPAYAELLGFASADEVTSSGVDEVAKRYAEGRFPYEISESGVNGEFRATLLIDGEPKQILERVRTVCDANGQVLWIQAAVADITETMKAELLERDIAVANAANAAKSSYLATMSHELRTPLHGVAGMLELIAGTELDQQQQKLVGNARHSANSLLSQINDILDLSKIESGKFDLSIAPFDLSQLVEEVVVSFSGAVKSDRLELICDIDPSLSQQVIGDRNRIRQILANFVGNAIKFTEQGEIRISAARGTDDFVRLEVADTGSGMTAEELKVIFEPYKQTESESVNTRGTGLGLAICSELAEMMGGQVDATSTKGVGSTFTAEVHLPANGHTQDSAVGTLRSLRILAVDDRKSNLMMLSRLLESMGHRVETLNSPTAVEAALSNAEKLDQPFELLITDHLMPEQDGIELAAALRSNSRWESLPIVIASSSPLGVSNEEAELVGIEHAIAKPIRRADLEAAIDLVISQLVEDSSFEATADNCDTPACSEEDEQKSFAGVRVLVAEDNAVNQCFCEHVLGAVGVDLTIVDDGGPAFDAIRSAHEQERPYQIVFMDCQMIETDGFAATRMIRQWEADAGVDPVTIVALTANAVVGDREQCLAAGMSDYMTKPISAEAMRGAVAKALETQAVPATSIAASGLAVSGQEDNSAIQSSDPAGMADTVAYEPETTLEDDAGLECGEQEHSQQTDEVQDIESGPMSETDFAGLIGELAGVGEIDEEIVDVDEASLLNLTELRERCLDDDEFMVAVLMQFAQELPSELDRIRAAAELADYDEVAKSAHTIRGFSGNVAAEAVYDSAKNVEAISEQEGSNDLRDQAIRILARRVDLTLNRVARLVDELQGEPMS